ncbi:hypothetical protein DL768_011433 [Monosporascus sp. mg162]|nr:hypothetical protein DL768_011433 [Monosporascus sp. mg162]
MKSSIALATVLAGAAAAMVAGDPKVAKRQVSGFRSLMKRLTAGGMLMWLATVVGPILKVVAAPQAQQQ